MSEKFNIIILKKNKQIGKKKDKGACCVLDKLKKGEEEDRKVRISCQLTDLSK